MSRRWTIFRMVSETAFTAGITFSAYKWSSYVAYVDRGNMAVGGEVIFSVAAGYVAYKMISLLFDALEEALRDELRRRRKERNMQELQYGKRALGQRPERPHTTIL